MPDAPISGLSPAAAPALSSMVAVRIGGQTFRTTLAELAAVLITASTVGGAGGVLDSDFAGADLGSLIRTGVGTYALLKHNLVATAPPSTTDDSSESYAIGSRWVDVALDNFYVCVDATEDAAVWRHLNLPASFSVYDGAPGAENPPDASNVVNLAFSGASIVEGSYGGNDYALVTILEDTTKGPAFMDVVEVTGNITLSDALHNNAILNCTAAADISVNIGLSPGFSCVILRNTAATVQIAAGSTATGIASTAATGSGPINQGEAMTVISLSSTTYTVQGNL